LILYGLFLQVFCVLFTELRRIAVTLSERGELERGLSGGIITAKDSKWLMSYTLNRQPHFKEQPQDQLVVWVYGLFTDVPGDYIKKPMKECTGLEITEEWLYQRARVRSNRHSIFSNIL
jgi:myosin-crossreactive antigen